MGPTLRIEYVPLARAVGLLWRDNPKLHSIGDMAESIKRHGFRDAPAFDANLQEDGAIVDGNGRVETLARMRDQGQDAPLGITVDGDGEWHLPVQFGLDAPSRAAAEAYAVDVNNLTMAGGDYDLFDMARMWEDGAYADVLKRLAEADFLPVTVDGADLDSLLAELIPVEPPEDPGPQIDRAAELQEKWAVKRGQVWKAGRQTIMCGDSTEVEDVECLMAGESVRLLFTSPPYWVGKAYEKEKAESQIDTFIRSCVRAWTDFVDVDYGRIVINTGTAAIHRIEQRRKVEVLPLIDKWAGALRRRGWLARHFRIWAKSGTFPALISARSDVVDQHWEHVVTFESEWSYLGTWWAPMGRQRGQETIGMPWAQQGIWLDIPSERTAGGLHIAAFPLDLPARNMILYTKRGEIVADYFVGCGTSLVACEQNGRVGYGMDISEKYVSAALERLQGMGLEPRLA